ncbi:hypothetical protein APHNP_0182 [Anaplasma phagocytophilum str. ApNP]|uniref:Uncharacterized protein n=1 Tax=Anaplasma phagocytophilum str. ApNP TaxID=1359153 RepID=A0A0F3NHR8_ANAPH|nr:hypothetical protein APHNP_0182 [Anaplasma phagocytophilum str. ApNP]
MLGKHVPSTVGAIGYWSDTAKFLLNNSAAVVPSVVFGAPNFFLYFMLFQMTGFLKH